MRKLLFVICSLGLLFYMMALPAQANHVFSTEMTVWYGAPYTLTVGLDNATTWTTNQRAAVLAAMAELNSERSPSWTGAHVGPTLQDSGWANGSGSQGTESAASTCNQTSQIVVSRYDGPIWNDNFGEWTEGTTHAVTPAYCLQGVETRQYYRAHITLQDLADNPGTSYDDSGYWGSSIPEPAFRQGERGNLVHELMHAVGLSIHWEGLEHDDTDADPYCLEDGDVAPANDGSPSGGSYKTLCGDIYSTFPGTQNNNISNPYSNWGYTMNVHDVDLYNDWYAYAYDPDGP